MTAVISLKIRGLGPCRTKRYGLAKPLEAAPRPVGRRYHRPVSSWSCPHEVDGVCQKVKGALCDPGMLGCVLQGRVERLDEPNVPRRPVRKGGESQARRSATTKP